MREKADHLTKKAKKEGYPARSVYKLMEIQEKMSIIKRGDRVLDIGASPGSWTRYALKEVNGGGEVIAVDRKALGKVSLSGRYQFLKGDIFSSDIQEELKKHSPFDVLISDAAPDTTGNRTVDTGRSYTLCDGILDLALEFLKTGGNCVIKVFQGGDEQRLLGRLRREYAKAKPFKPKASRNESFEVYFIGMGKKGS